MLPAFVGLISQIDGSLGHGTALVIPPGAGGAGGDVSFNPITKRSFEPIELQGDDLRNERLVDRKQRLAEVLALAGNAIRFNEHLAHDGPAVFEHASRLGLEGIVSKRIDSPYRSGTSTVWLKSKNPLSEAVRREREEDWNS